MNVDPLKIEQLRWRCFEQQFEFSSTDELDALDGPIGQARAMTAIDLSLGIKDDGFNLFVSGRAGTGRLSAITRLLKERANGEDVPPDWCCVHDLDTGSKPLNFSIPAGKGRTLQEDVAVLIKRISEQLPKIFESKEYEQYKGKITTEYQKKNKQLFDDLEAKAAEQGFGIQRTVSGLVLVPAANGQPLTQLEYDALDEDERRQLNARGAKLQHLLDDVLGQIREIETEVQAAVSKMEKQIVNMTIRHLFKGLEGRYSDFVDVVDHLQRCQNDIADNIDEFRPKKESRLVFAAREGSSGGFWERYQINLFVDNSDVTGAPVVFEANPTYFNLFGRIEHVVHMGNATTDFTMVKSGALHRANGGYLVINCRDLLMNYFSYEALKRCLRNKSIKMEDIAEQVRLISVASLKPEPIPFSCKVILIGESMIYNLLHRFDHDFRKYFKVRADFNHYLDNTWGNVTKYAQFVAVQCRENNLPHFDRSAVSGVVEYAARLVEDQDKLSSRFLEIADLVKEAAHYAGQQNKTLVTAEQVKLAVVARQYRSNRIEEELQRLLLEGIILVDCDGRQTGQINGLSVYQLGDYSFGLPTRITATTCMGKAGVVNIEREVKQSGAVHDKGMLILTGFFGQRFAQDKPLTFSASICFEQTYGGVEGDSASSTELYALLSSLANLPIRQDIAVTGSVNQFGQLQAIGGVNDKIEGFYALCKLVGLTGQQGVMIPQANVKHLMLAEEVVAACAEGQFHVWAVSTVDEGIELLTGVPAGKKVGQDWEEGSVNAQVDARLRALAEQLVAFTSRD
ncbi:MAG: AAA family ATPase [Desulfuromonas sp.]|nr:AAA family ATPase [Desulfuromonas sp.]